MAQRTSTNPILVIVLVAVIAGAGFTMFKRLSHPTTTLETALNAQDDAAAKAWVDHGIDYEQLSIGGGQYTPLYFAAAQDMAPTVHLFLEHGAKANTPDELGHTPLMAAADTLDANLLKDLIEHGADVNAVTKDGETALMDAAKASLPPSKRVPKGAKADVASKMLMEAAQNSAKKREEAIKVLIDKKADPNLGNVKGIPTVFRITDSQACEDLLINAGLKPDIKTADGKNLLSTLSLSRASAEKLIAGGVDVNAKDKAGETALMFGTDAGVASVLIAHGADVNAVDSKHLTALFHAAMLSPAPIDKVDVLLQHGAKVDVSDSYGETLMHYVGVKREQPLIDLLVKHGGVAVVIPKRPKKERKGGGGVNAG